MTPFEQAARTAGVTYRQADYWRRKGYIEARYFTNDGDEIERSEREDWAYAMTGFRAYLDHREARVLAYMGRLTKAGLEPRVAAQAARHMMATHRKTYEPAPGVKIVLSDPEPKGGIPATLIEEKP
jgi:cobalamin biosynthesis protein CobT